MKNFNNYKLAYKVLFPGGEDWILLEDGSKTPFATENTYTRTKTFISSGNLRYSIVCGKIGRIQPHTQVKGCWKLLAPTDYYGLLAESSKIGSLQGVYSPLKLDTKQLLDYSRDELRCLTGLLTGHCRFNNHMQRLGLLEDSVCRLCLENDGTAEHILCAYPAGSRIWFLEFGRAVLLLLHMLLLYNSFLKQDCYRIAAAIV